MHSLLSLGLPIMINFAKHPEFGCRVTSRNLRVLSRGRKGNDLGNEVGHFPGEKYSCDITNVLAHRDNPD